MAGLSSNARFDQFGFDMHTRDLERLWLLYDGISGQATTVQAGQTVDLGADLTAIQGLQGSGYLYKVQPGAWEFRSAVPYSDVSGAPTSWALGGVLNGTTLTAGINPSGVSAGSYGSASAVATFTVGTDGRVTAASTAAIAIAQSQVTNLVTDLANKQPLDADLTAIAALASTGIAVRTAADTWAVRSLTQPAAGITITNPAGIAGNPTFALANDLAAVEALATTGLIRRTGTDTWTAGTQVATAEIADLAVTNAKLGNASVSTGKIDTIDSPAANLILTMNAIGSAMSWRKVSTDMVNDGQITSAKLAPMSWTAFLGAIGSSPSISLTSEVTGILPIANGGTGTATPTATASNNNTDTTDNGALVVGGTFSNVTYTLNEKRPRFNAKWLKGYEVDTTNIIATGSTGAQIAHFSNSTDVIRFGAQIGAGANGSNGSVLVAYTTGASSFEIGEVAPVASAATGYVLGINTDLSVAGSKPAWLRDIVLGQGILTASSSAGRLRVVKGTDGDVISLCDTTTSWVDIYDRSQSASAPVAKILESTKGVKVQIFDPAVSTVTPLVQLDIADVAALNATGRQVKLTEIDECDSTGAAKKRIYLCSAQY